MVGRGQLLRNHFEEDEDDVTLAPEIVVKEPERKPRADRQPRFEIQLQRELLLDAVGL